MKIAVTYDNGNVFQHFGRTETFKVYEVENGEVVDEKIVGSEGAGHEALAGLLADKGIDVLICGGCGAGAQAALAEAGVELLSGAEGNCDAVVDAYLRGDLTSKGVTCDHHDHEDEEGGCGGNCGGGCGGCGGGCHMRLSSKALIQERLAEFITLVLSMTVPSLILPTTEMNRLSSSLVGDI